MTELEKDLLGDEVKLETYDANGKGKRKPAVAKGYAMPPGTGPEGETCGSCNHHAIRTFAKVYHKCDLTNWTNGTATDIRVRSPACSKWEEIDYD